MFLYNNMFFRILLLLLVVFAVTSASLVSQCPEVKPVDVDLSVSMGLWYQNARYPNEVEKSTKCVSVVTEAKENGFRSESVGIPKDSPYYIYYDGTVLPNEETTGKFNMTITSKVFDRAEHFISQYVGSAATYLVVYGCVYDDSTNSWTENAWIFSRSKQITKDDQDNVNKAIAANKAIDINKFLWIDNTDCDNDF